MNKALQKKLGLIETKKEAEHLERTNTEKSKKEDKGKKGKHVKLKSAGIAVMSTQLQPSSKNRKQSLVDEERKLHESYQLILGEHHRRVHQRIKHGYIQVPSNTNSNATLSSDLQPHQQCHCFLKHSKQDSVVRIL